MKSIYILLFSLFSLVSLHAQQISDGLRYSTSDNLGSARNTALSGAMGALGGDLSAMETNPAGGAVFSNSQAIFSTNYSNKQNDATYFNQKEHSSTNRFNLNQAGGVFVLHNSNESSKFKKLSIGVNYSLQKNFSDELFLAGIGNTSITEFFLARAQGIPLDLLDLQSGESITSLYRYLGETSGTAAQNAFLGYQGYLFDPADPNDPNNTTYISNVSGDKFDQQYLNLTSGYNTRFTINVAAQVSDNLYFGANINTHGFDYRQNDYFYESNNNPESFINRIKFRNTLNTYGSGISAQVGAIAKVSDRVRLGLSLDTPTWLHISEETSQRLESRRFEDGTNKTAVVDPKIINVFEDYTLRTPGKATVSAAYIFGQSGLISLDYSYKGFSDIKFSPSSNAHFKNLNKSINNQLKGSSSIRAGGEYLINRFSLRGGFHFEESPYKNNETTGDLIGYSLGAGVKLGLFNIDLAYLRSEQNSKFQMYSVGFTDKADIKNVYNSVVLSLVYSL